MSQFWGHYPGQRLPPAWPPDNDRVDPLGPAGRGARLSLPRRVSVASLFVVTLGFALLFATVRAVGGGWGTTLYLSLLVVVVGAAQYIWPQQPRSASVLTGSTYGGISAALFVMLKQVQHPLSLRDLMPLVLVFFLEWALLFALVGYVIGRILSALGWLIEIAEVKTGRNRPAAADQPATRTTGKGGQASMNQPPADDGPQMLPLVAATLVSESVPVDSPAVADTEFRSSGAYHVPRRLSLSAVLGATLFFAMLFSVIRALGGPWLVHVWFGTLVVTVAVAQMWFPQNPRAASAIAGVVHGGVAFVATAIMAALLFPNKFNANGEVITALGGVICNSPILALSGYLTGTVVSSFWLIADQAEQWRQRRFGHGPEVVTGIDSSTRRLDIGDVARQKTTAAGDAAPREDPESDPRGD